MNTGQTGSVSSPALRPPFSAPVAESATPAVAGATVQTRIVFEVVEIRSMRHPVYRQVQRHFLLMAAKDVRTGLSNGANARHTLPKDLSKPVYREVTSSLLGDGVPVGAFDLMNRGITVLAVSLRRVGARSYEVFVPEQLGTVDGRHTYTIITERLDDIPDEQHVLVEVITGLDDDLIPLIAKGRNTAIQVKPEAISNLEGRYDAIKAILRGTGYGHLVAYGDGEEADYGVAYILSVLEALNTVDYANGIKNNRDPIAAYEKQGAVSAKFRDPVRGQAFPRLYPVLTEALALHDVIRHDFMAMHNANGGSAGKLNIVERARGREGQFSFPFAAHLPGIGNREYRLTKGALFPILAAFRNCVELGPDGNARWVGGSFQAVLDLWRDLGPLLVGKTIEATRNIGRNPDMLGKNREHWRNLNMAMYCALLEQRISEGH